MIDNLESKIMNMKGAFSEKNERKAKRINGKELWLSIIKSTKHYFKWQ